jgi:GT2 family glycosyltransferase
VDILIPTFNRPAALAVTLTALLAQDMRLRVVISDQGDQESRRAPEVCAVVRILEANGHAIVWHRHLPRRGLAEQRAFLLGEARSDEALFLDDDVVLAPGALGPLQQVLESEGCGFVGYGLIGLSFREDKRPQEQEIEWWDGPVVPETVTPYSPAWNRHRLHNAANLYHVGAHLRVAQRYRVAWIGGCVLYRVEALRAVGGFAFWRDLPQEHCGEDVLAQLRVMARFGGCGLLPSRAYHQELPTTVVDRRVDAAKVLSL